MHSILLSGKRGEELGAKRRLIILSYAGLCIYRITIGRRGSNSVLRRAPILGDLPKVDVEFYPNGAQLFAVFARMCFITGGSLACERHDLSHLPYEGCEFPRNGRAGHRCLFAESD